MVASSRLNLLVTHRDARAAATRDPWYQTMTQLLTPLGVRTFEATTAPEAITMIEHNPIHLAVVDTRLEGLGGQLGVLRLIRKLRDQTHTAAQAATAVDTSGQHKGAAEKAAGSFRVQVQIQSHPQGQRIEVHMSRPPEPPPVISPTVILLTPSRNDALLHEALECNAFSVVTEPVDVNMMLELMARALRRFHQNLWPQ